MSSTSYSAQKQALADALAQVQEHDRAQREAAAAARRPRPSRRPAILAGLAIALTAFAGYIVVARPDWFVSPPPPPESAEVHDASMRMAMYATALRLEDYRAKHGALPDSLAEIGEAGTGLGYSRAGAAWTLRGGVGAGALTLTSADTLAAFVGSSWDVLARRSER
jgi:hypothetical protein